MSGRQTWAKRAARSAVERPGATSAPPASAPACDADGGTTWAALDRDMLAAIAGWLDSAHDVAALACTCRDARTVAAANAVWSPLLARHFGLRVQVRGRKPPGG